MQTKCLRAQTVERRGGTARAPVMLRSDFALRQNQARSRAERKADDLPPLYGIMLMIIWITIRRPVLLKCHQTEAAGELEKDDNSPVHRGLDSEPPTLIPLMGDGLNPTDFDPICKRPRPHLGGIFGIATPRS